MTKVKEVSALRVGDNSPFPSLIGETLVVTLSDGMKLQIELFEREPGVLGIRCDGQLLVLPAGGANCIGVKVNK